MSPHPVSAGDREDAAQFKHDLLGRLGLQSDASRQDVEAAHNVLVEFLELAPHKANSWAAARTADMDEAFALLSGPEHGLISASQRASRAQSMGKTSDAPGIAGAPTGQQTTAPSGGPSVVPVDQAKVAALMKKVSANPKDTASLLAVGDIYFAAADYKDASVFEQKVLGVDPKNQAALLAVGAAQFNLGNADEAKKQWLVAAGLYPKSAEVHYDLGFLYLSQTPPDKANMTTEWNKVIAIDPNSAIAKAVATHLKGSTPTPGAK